PSGTTFNDAGLGLGTTHSYAVRARDKAGNASALSSAVTATTKTAECSQVPPVPSGLTSPGQASSSVDLAWTASHAGGNCTVKYNVFRDGTLVTQVATNSAKILNLVSSTTYRFTVAAVDEVGSSAQSAALSVTTLAGRAARVGYFVQWGIYGRQYFVRNLDTTGAAAKLTHLLYAFSNVDPVNLTCLNGVVKGTTADPEDPNQGDGAGDASADYTRPAAASESVDGVGDIATQKLMGNFNQLLKLKAKYPQLRVLISIGGWTYSKFLSDAALSDASRKKFVGSCIDLYLKGHLPLSHGA